MKTSRSINPENTGIHFTSSDYVGWFGGELANLPASGAFTTTQFFINLSSYAAASNFADSFSNFQILECESIVLPFCTQVVASATNITVPYYYSLVDPIYVPGSESAMLNAAGVMTSHATAGQKRRWRPMIQMTLGAYTQFAYPDKIPVSGAAINHFAYVFATGAATVNYYVFRVQHNIRVRFMDRR